MPKMHYFSNKFSKIANPSSTLVTWSYVTCLTKLWFFKLIVT